MITRTSFIGLATLMAAAPGWGALIQFSGSGASSAALLPTVSAYQSALGGANNGTAACSPSPCTNGFRVINWDGVPDAVASPNAFPGTFFDGTAAPRARGAAFTTPGTGFQVSANPGVAPVRFGNINATYSSIFITFSAERLFTPIGSNVTDVFFFQAGSPSIAAFTSGFGAVFTNVTLSSTSSVQFFDANNASLGQIFATSAPGGLSFAGGLFNAGERVGRVRITSGNTALGPNDGPGANVVALDDFIFGEPQAIPEPSSIVLAGAGLALMSLVNRRRRQLRLDVA